MNDFIRVYAFLVFLLIPLSGFSTTVPAPESWDRERALQASVSIDTAAERSRLMSHFKAGDSEATLEVIQQVRLNSDWPAPARERFILDFVNGLRHEPRAAVDERIIDHIESIQPIVYVPHEDHPHSNVPLYNIRAVMAGVENGWSRSEGAFEGAVLLERGPEALLQAYQQEQDSPKRLGMTDALESAGPGQLKAVAQLAIADLAADPGLFAIAGKASLLARDIDALESLVRSSGGPGMSRLLRESAALLDTAAAFRILNTALDHASPGTAALAIAQLAPVLKDHEATQSLLIEQLGDPQIGSAAALALASHPGPGMALRLEQLAKTDNSSLAARRARLALKLVAKKVNGEALP
jgi:hypothetical protein